MPVRTRSQRLKEELTSSSSGSEPSVTMSAPRIRTRKSSTSKKSSKTSRNSKRNGSEKEEMEIKSEEVTSPTPSFSTEPVTKPQQHEASPYKSNVDEFRKYVKNILDSPNKVDLPKTQSMTGPSPRIERITIQHQKDQQMEFLIPPKPKDEPLEIRERIRAALSPHAKPETVQFEPIKSKSKSPSYPPVYNEGTHLWSPTVPTYNEDDAERISRWLMILIFSILTAIFFSYYQAGIAAFLKNQLTPLGQSLKQGMEWISANISSVWSSILNIISGFGSSDAVQNGTEQMDDVNIENIEDIGDVGDAQSITR